MRRDADPAREPGTPLGYSVGRWEGETLVVRTTRISWPYLTPNGRIPQSDAVEVEERFSVQGDTDQMVYDLTITDAATLTEPVILHAVFDWRPDLVVEPYERTLDG